MTESLTKAAQSAEFLRRDLRAALTQADAVQALVILPMIERATMLERDAYALLMAVEESAK